MKYSLPTDTDVATNDDDGQLYFDEKWVARRLGFTVKAIQSWREKGVGPVHRKMQSGVRYSLKDLEAYEEASRRKSTSDNGQGGCNA